MCCCRLLHQVAAANGCGRQKQIVSFYLAFKRTTVTPTLLLKSLRNTHLFLRVLLSLAHKRPRWCRKLHTMRSENSLGGACLREVLQSLKRGFRLPRDTLLVYYRGVVSSGPRFYHGITERYELRQQTGGLRFCDDPDANVRNRKEECECHPFRKCFLPPHVRRNSFRFSGGCIVDMSFMVPYMP